MEPNPAVEANAVTFGPAPEVFEPGSWTGARDASTCAPGPSSGCAGGGDRKPLRPHNAQARWPGVRCLESTAEAPIWTAVDAPRDAPTHGGRQGI